MALKCKTLIFFTQYLTDKYLLSLPENSDVSVVSWNLDRISQVSVAGCGASWSQASLKDSWTNQIVPVTMEEAPSCYQGLMRADAFGLWTVCEISLGEQGPVVVIENERCVLQRWKGAWVQRRRLLGRRGMMFKGLWWGIMHICMLSWLCIEILVVAGEFTPIRSEFCKLCTLTDVDSICVGNLIFVWGLEHLFTTIWLPHKLLLELP